MGKESLKYLSPWHESITGIPQKHLNAHLQFLGQLLQCDFRNQSHAWCLLT